MKKAEAISILATSVRPREAKDRARYDEAVKMAIEALKCSETPKSSERTSETAQADHIADTGRKVEQAAEIAQNTSSSCGQENDLISRQAAIDTIMGQPPEPHYPSWYAAQIEKLPAVQPDRNVIDDCLCHIYKNISVHTATGGVIAIRYYMEKLYEEIYGEGERPWWMT